jgi:transcription elongation GreA/GreB family factor
VSRAFIKEHDDRPEELLERPISTHANLVTRDGLALIEQHLGSAGAAVRSAQSAGDDVALARAARDLRYWESRRHTAQLMPEPKTDGRRQTFRIVGEDEADPSRNRISYVSPLARALLESRTGDTVQAGASEATIIKVE